MNRPPRESIDSELVHIKVPSPTADLGVAPTLLPASLLDDYLVETSYEDDVVRLIADDPRRLALLAELGPRWRRIFGPEVRAMLAQHWSLFEPISAELHLYVHTSLDEQTARAELDLLRRVYAASATAAGLYIHITRLVRD